jgi:hypothetical protein
MAHLSYDAPNCAQECPIIDDRKPLAETIVHSNGAVYYDTTSLINLTLFALQGAWVYFVLLDPSAKIQLKRELSFAELQAYYVLFCEFWEFWHIKGCLTA